MKNKLIIGLMILAISISGCSEKKSNDISPTEINILTEAERGDDLEKFRVSVPTPEYVSETLSHYKVDAIKTCGSGVMIDINPDSCRICRPDFPKYQVSIIDIHRFGRYLEIISVACCKLADTGIIDNRILEDDSIFIECDLKVIIKQTDGQYVTHCYASPWRTDFPRNGRNRPKLTWNPANDTEYLIGLLWLANWRVMRMFYVKNEE